MAKVTLVTPDKVVPCDLPDGIAGQVRSGAYLAGPGDPLHLHCHSITPGEALHIGPRDIDSLAYVWTGAVSAGTHMLSAGSSLVVERGGAQTLISTDLGAQVLVFAAAKAPSQPRVGGHVHLLPVERVPRIPAMIPGVAGGLHFDSACPTCELWLHENMFSPEFATPETQSRSPHCHTEDEIIFITRGEARLGNRTVGPGTALAVHALTMYTFDPGPEGLGFINFRPVRPGENRRADGRVSREADGWEKHLDGKRPDYINLTPPG
jgi:hypothetical protein